MTKNIYIFFLLTLFQAQLLLSIHREDQLDPNTNDKAWTIYVALNTTPKERNILSQTSTHMKKLCSRHNLELYQQKYLNFNDFEKLYALNYATYKNCIPTVENLLKHDTNTSTLYNNFKMTAYDIAQQLKHENIVAIFKKCNLPYYFTNNHYPSSALATYMCDDKSLSTIINNNILLNDDPYGQQTLLHIATYFGNSSIVKCLLQNDALKNKINFIDRNENTSLQVAVMLNKISIVELLLTIPTIDVNKHNNNQRSALHIACSKGYDEIAQLLLKHSNIKVNLNPLFIAAGEGHLSCVKVAYDYDAELINKNDFYHQYDSLLTYFAGKTINCSPLAVACYNNHEKIVKFLLKQKNLAPESTPSFDELIKTAYSKEYDNIATLLLIHQLKKSPILNFLYLLTTNKDCC